jgi:ABC-type polysaccharide/polyol phosphate transport system ATPase subunit
MTGNAIEVEHLSKRYRLGGEHARAHASGGHCRVGARPGRPQPHEELWSLRDVSFQVPEGQSFGVVGRNGAGKSTLLKILARITQPTAGRSRTRRRLAPLLEVSTGFHPELTGRENVYLNGAILGMSRRDTARRFEEVVTFAGVERFVDTPVKRTRQGCTCVWRSPSPPTWSPTSWWSTRSWPWATPSSRPSALGWMTTVGREGRTVVFVSHNLEAITRLYSHAVWLDQGVIGPSAPPARSSTPISGPRPGDRGAGRRPWRTGRAPVGAGAGRRIQAGGGDAAGPAVHRGGALPGARGRAGLDIAIHLYNVRDVEVLSEGWGDTVLDRPNDPASTSRACRSRSC